MFYLRHLKSVRSGKTPFLLKSVLSLTILLLTVVVLQSMLKLRSQASRLKSDTCESAPKHKYRCRNIADHQE